MNDVPKPDVVIFTEAAQLPVEERHAFLDHACAGDGELRCRIEALLRAHERTGDFLAEPPQGLGEESGRRVVLGEKAGDQIGRYKLLQQIGEGGCGVVYMAEQEEPVRRRVALKIIKVGMDSKSVIARFETERQALALMDHPNIAKIFDAGATESGRPYFVMELVRGVKIAEYCDEHSLTTEERLELFVQVCHAVQHAHQKGIIHRDIKPSNILVTMSLEGVAVPVVIDFGIAKATTNQRLTDQTLFTAFEMLIGTPAYMSPEQAAFTSVDVDTRTDIYSLGVLLYELLTGSTPFDTRELLKAGLDEIRRVIREEEPVRPSARLSKMTGVDLTSVAQLRKSEPPRLIRTICGDLDWIAMKALEKNRTRRYETANGMALDVQRYLANEPISARPPSRLYKLQKTVLRNKLLFSGIGVIAGLLIISLIVVSASLAKERQARRDADGARQQAEVDKAKAQTEAVKSQQVTQFLENMLQGVGPSVALGQDTTMLRGILDRTAERIGNEMANQPAVEAELRNLIGTLYQRIGKYGRAEDMHRAALSIRRELFGPQSPEAAASLNDLGLDLMAQRKPLEANGVVAEALAIRRKLFGNENADTATSLNDLGAIYRDEGRLTEAEAMAREALAIRQRLLGTEDLQVADSLRNLSIILGAQGKWPECETMAREVLAMRRKLLGSEHPWVASSLNDVAWAAGSRGKLDEAEALQQEALAMRRRLLPEVHPGVALSLRLVGDSMRKRGNLKEAYSVLSAALSIQRKLLGEAAPASLDTLRSLGLTLEADQKWQEAEAVHREALALRRKLAGNEDPHVLVELESVIRALMAQKQFRDAEQLLDEALTPAFVKQSSSASILTLRADLKARRGQWQEAATDAALALEHQPFDHTRFCILAALLVKSHNRSAYEQLCKRLLASFADTTNVYVADQVAKACLFLPADVDLQVVDRLADTAVTKGIGDTGAMPFFQNCKALSEYRLGHYAKAVEWAQMPLEIPNNYVHGHAYAVLAMAYWQLGKKDEARAMLAKGDMLQPRIMPVSVAEDRENAWQAWLYARIQLDEAAELIRPVSRADLKSNKP